MMGIIYRALILQDQYTHIEEVSLQHSGPAHSKLTAELSHLKAGVTL